MFRYPIFLFICVFAVSLHGQLKSNVNQLNYGKVEIWKNDTLDIVIKNKAKTVAQILPTYNPDVELIGPRKILPGASQVYQVVAYPRVKGYFEFKPTYYFSNANQPVVFTIKGQIKTFDESALYQCPRLENKSKKFEIPQMLIKVIDTFTRKIIYHAEAEVSNPINRISFEGGYMNVLTHFGNYRASVSAQGYEPKQIAFLFDSKNQEIIIELKPLDFEEEIEEEVEEGDDNEYITLEDVNPDNAKHKLEKEEVVEEEIREEVVKKEEPKKDSVVVEGEILKEWIEELDTLPRLIAEKGEVDEQDPIEKLGEQYQKAKLKPQHIIILADVSFSMQRSGYLDGLKRSLNKTIEQLRPEDSLTIITFSSSNTVLADHIGISQRDSLRDAIHSIKAKGGTNAKIALKSAYGVARRYRSESTQTQVILFTDGKFNTPGTAGGWYGSYVDQKYNAESIHLSILSFSDKPSDYRFLDAISSKTDGQTQVINEAIGLEILHILMRQ